MSDTSYELTIRQIEQLFSCHIQGAASPLLCVLSWSGVSEESRRALLNSANVLGYAYSCAFVQMEARLADSGAVGSGAAGSGAAGSQAAYADAAERASAEEALTEAVSAGRKPAGRMSSEQEQTEANAAPSSCLDARSLFMLIEGLDPHCMIVTDERAAQLLAEAYRGALAFDGLGRLFGRSVLAFRDFEKELVTKEARQKAWAFLKQLPKIGV